ncbi:hypothetical protein niasHT_017052 [Heterodera trifolii]|uniref:C2H2-type domain-containing protein n=1 Tax=Heterodera trifolii TaxID=157864 RepID=A0ABD2KXY0_9BILA
MRPSFTSSCSVRSVASQRRCFLIDSLLEERQKRLAATVAAKHGTNAFNPPEEPKREEIGKETMPELNLEDKGPISGTKNDGTEGEETASEEVLPTFEEEKETNTSGGTDRTDQRVGPAGIGNDQHSKALLEALNKLVPVAVRQGAEQTERQGDREAGESAVGREGGETEKGQAAEFLYKLHLFQQQLASSAAASVPWPFVPPGHSPISTNFFRLPLFPVSSFSLPTNPSNNRMPKCFSSPSNPWRHLMPTTSMPTSVKCRIKAPNSQNINGTSGMNSAQMDSFNYSSEWTMPNFFNSGPASAVLATIGAFRAAAAASAQNHGTNGSRNSGSANKANLTNNKNGNKIGRRSCTAARQQQRHATNGNRNTRSSNAKKYRCDICDKTFSRSNTLITHKRIHTGEKPFRCEHCGRAFRQPGNLTRHAYTHTTVKPFVCAECGKAFNRASNLQAHLRVHSTGAAGTKLEENGGGSALKQCKRCESNFATRAELRAHRCQ